MSFFKTMQSVKDSKVLGDIRSSLKDVKLVKEVHCAVCGNKAGLLTRQALKDGNYICFDCMPKLPSYVSECLAEHYDLEGFMQLKDYLRYSEEVLKPRFSETAHYGKLHMDEENGIFYIEEGFFSEPLYCEMKHVSFFDLEFRPEELKEGFLGDKVTGNVLAILNVTLPSFVYVKTVATNVKGKAKKKLLSTTVTYENPEAMEDFKLRFLLVWSRYIVESGEQEQTLTGAEMSELEKAKVLFMLEDVENLTLEQVKKQRNRLIRMYHPDTGSDADTKFAQKINNAYEILKNSIN